MYLDNAATTPLSVNVKSEIMSFLNNYGNPSSHHSVGDGARDVLAKCREDVANFINAKSSEIVFTSSGSASNNLAVQGWLKRHGGNIYYSPTSHKSILKMFDADKNGLLSINSTTLPLCSDGKIDCVKLSEWLLEDNEEALVVFEYANSEVGIIQPVADIVTSCNMLGVHTYIDCTGSIAQIPVDVKKLGVDMIGFSAHKLGGLKGCGALYIREGFEIDPLIYGAQEEGLFAGTENMLGIVSLAAAVRDYDYKSITTHLRDYLISSVSTTIPNVHVVGGGLPHNVYLVFDGVEGEQLMTLLDSKGFQVSVGSACNSGVHDLSPTLKALGIKHDGIRITLSGNESFGGIDDFVKTLKDCVKWLRNE